MRAHNSPLAAAFNTARPAAADYADSPNVKICRHADSAGRLFACAGASRNRAGSGKLSANNRKEAMMSDYRDPNDPLMRNTAYEPAAGRTGTVWGWIAAAVFLVIILGIAFGVGHEPNRFASNEAVPPPVTHPSPLAPPAATTNPARPMAPGLAPAPAPVAPVAPTQQ
jgi:hypothetical protein